MLTVVVLVCVGTALVIAGAAMGDRWIDAAAAVAVGALAIAALFFRPGRRK